MSELNGLPGNRFVPVVQKDAEVISNGYRITEQCKCGKQVSALFLPNLRQTKFMECNCGQTVRIVYEPGSR